MASDNTADQSGRMLLRGLRLLEALSRNDSSPLRKLSETVGLPRSTVHRLLRVLEHESYVFQDSQSKEYRLTMKLFEVGSRRMTAIGLRERAFPLMESLMQQTGETVILSVLDGQMIVHVDRVESEASTGVTSPIGHRLPVHCTAAGKAILSAYPPAHRSTLLTLDDSAGGLLPRMTDRTIVQIEDLYRELEQISSRGYAIDHGESTPGVHALAAPIRGSHGAVLGAISVVGLAFRVAPDRFKELGPKVIDAVRQLEAAIRGEENISGGVA